MSNQLTQLTHRLSVHHGSINVGILRDGNRALLIDCGNGRIRSTLRTLGVTEIHTVLFTHHHRDQASGIESLAGENTRVGVPAQERGWFESVEDFWGDPKTGQCAKKRTSGAKNGEPILEPLVGRFPRVARRGWEEDTG